MTLLPPMLVIGGTVCDFAPSNVSHRAKSVCEVTHREC